jgi:hypothetical protein
MKPNRFSNDADKPFHSHTYAEAENGNAMGATSPETFNQRYRVDQNRRHIAKYRDSFVASSGHIREELNARLGIHSSDPVPEPPQTTAPGSRQAYNAGGVTPRVVSRPGPLQVPKRSYTEPPTRNYNPFS